MHIERLLPLDEVTSAVDAGRRGLGRIDLSGIPSSLGGVPSATIAAARDTIPGPWARPKPRWRWPLVGLLLVLGTAIVGLTLLAPALRRRVTGEPAVEPIDALAFDTEVTRETAADVDPDAAVALPLDGFATVANS